MKMITGYIGIGKGTIHVGGKSVKEEADNIKKKIKEVLKEHSGNDKIEIIKFIRFKVGEGV